MKKVIVLFSVVLLSSCQLFEKKVPDENQLLQEELKKIDWTQVDQYPTVSDCEALSDKEAQKQCFFDYVIQTIQERIGVDTIQIMYPEVDTISVKVTVNPDASLQFETQIPTDSITYDIKVIDSILQNRLADFPQVEPAIKRGIKVKSQFVLPVVIKVDSLSMQ